MPVFERHKTEFIKIHTKYQQTNLRSLAKVFFFIAELKQYLVGIFLV